MIKIGVFAQSDIFSMLNMKVKSAPFSSKGVKLSRLQGTYSNIANIKKDQFSFLIIQFFPDDLGGILDLQLKLDITYPDIPILAFEVLDRNRIVYFTTEETSSFLINEISQLFLDASKQKYCCIRDYTRLSGDIDYKNLEFKFGREKALAEILRGCCENEAQIYLERYNLDLRNHGYCLFFWELQQKEYLTHALNKDIFNYTGRIIDRSFYSILQRYDGGELFSPTQNSRCIIINMPDNKSNANNDLCFNNLLSELSECAHNSTALYYVSEKVQALQNIRLLKDQYEEDRSNFFFLRNKRIVSSGSVKQQMDMHYMLNEENPLNVLKKIESIIQYDINSVHLIPLIRSLYLGYIKQSMNFSFCFYCTSAINSALRKKTDPQSINVTTDILSPEGLRFFSVEDQCNTIISQVLNTRENAAEKKRIRNVIVLQAIDYIENNYHLSITIADIANELFVTESYLSRIFKKIVGETISSYLATYRINQAKKQLINSNDSIANISESCGFINTKHFSKVFKKITGLSPTQFRRIS